MSTFIRALKTVLNTAATPAYSRDIHPVREQETRKLDQYRSLPNL